MVLGSPARILLRLLRSLRQMLLSSDTTSLILSRHRSLSCRRPPSLVFGVAKKKTSKMPIADDMSRDSNNIYRQSNASRNVGRA